MADQRQNPAADDFDYIRNRINELKKEREEADKASNAPDEGMVPVFEGDYCVGMMEANLANSNLTDLYNEAVGTLDNANAAIGAETAPRDWQASSGYPLYDFLELDENDEVVGFAKAIKKTNWFNSGYTPKIGDIFIRNGIEYILLPNI